MATKYRYGLIDENHFSLSYPRVVDEDYATIEEAMEEATRRIAEEEGTQYSVVLCFFSKKHDCMVESSKSGCITIDASDWNGNEVIEKAEEAEAKKTAKAQPATL